MKKSLTAGAVAAAALAASSVVGFAPAAIAAPQPGAGAVGPLHATCGRAGPNRTGSHRVNNAPLNGAVNQRSGSSTGCGAVGVLQPTDDAIYLCWTLGNDGFTWTYLKNIRTGVFGWARDNLLKENGAAGSAGCGF